IVEHPDPEHDAGPPARTRALRLFHDAAGDGPDRRAARGNPCRAHRGAGYGSGGRDRLWDRGGVVREVSAGDSQGGEGADPGAVGTAGVLVVVTQTAP